MAHKILLVDDSITIQKVVSLTFSGGEYEVVAFGSGTEALNRIQDVNPAIILLDVIMPDIKGYQVCEKIKADPKFKDIPILLLTGTFEAFDEEEDGYLLAKLFVEAGLNIPKEVFVGYFRKIMKG